MEKYFTGNKEYYEAGYEAENVDHPVFRVYGTIFRDDFGIDGSRGEKLLDFGCGQGAAVNFFAGKGFEAYGIDISETDIRRAGERYTHIADRFEVISPKPKEDDVFFGGGYDVVVAIQSLHYLSDTDMKVRLKSLYDQMPDGAILFATMLGTQSYYWDHATPYEDGLYKITIDWDRVKVNDYYTTFVRNEQDLVRKFSLFQPVHTGFYTARFRSDEGEFFFYSFVGRKE